MTTVTESATTRAIVVGASMGGLLAARAISEHVDEVLVLERDENAFVGRSSRCGRRRWMVSE